MDNDIENAQSFFDIEENKSTQTRKRSHEQDDNVNLDLNSEKMSKPEIEDELCTHFGLLDIL